MGNQLDLNFYSRVSQQSKSLSSSSQEDDNMLLDIEEDEDDMKADRMTNIEMLHMIGSPVISPNTMESSQLIHTGTGSRRKSKMKRKKRKQNDGSFLHDIFQRCQSKKKVIDVRDRRIHYDAEGNISAYKGKKRYSVRKRSSFGRNTINNQKYSLVSFFPLFLYEQFNQFWNLYFLFVAITQLPIPGSIFEDFWIGYWWTTVLPLLFVVSISMLRELFDDIQRKKRDYLINNEKYKKLNTITKCTEKVSACNIKLGDLIILNEGDRVPCDMVLLCCQNESGTTFIKTDQLDGETDWKLRRPIQSIQKTCHSEEDSLEFEGTLTVEAPHLNIYKFVGKFEDSADESVQPLNLENTLWGSTRIASEGTIIGCAIYLGKQSRGQLNVNEKTYKTGLIDQELNRVTKILVAMLIFISFALTMARGLTWKSYLYFGRFMLILSDIIPLSLRVYMDLCKIWFSFMISRDDKIPNTTVRCTTIPEELGRIQYLFSDKTGTLTQNEMIFQKLQLKPPLLFQAHNFKLVHHHFVNQTMKATRRRRKIKKKKKVSSKRPMIGIDELEVKLQNELANSTQSSLLSRSDRSNTSYAVSNKSVSAQVKDAVEALGICHNVTPILKDEGLQHYEASSPDEIAMVKFTERCGIKLVHRSTDEITLRVYENLSNDGDFSELYDGNDEDNDYVDLQYKILNVFPFTSDAKRMGIVVQNKETEQITFYAKGADSVMKNMVESNEWMEEEVENLSREGLRTLVFAKKQLSQQEYDNFLTRYDQAAISMNSSRKLQMDSVKSTLLEQDMELLCISGVEDKLQNNVQSTIEILRNARIKIWMLTGDKVETAKVIARSSRLIAYGQEIYELIIKNKRDAYHKLDILYGKANHNLAIVIDGKSLEIFMHTDDNLKNQFLEYVIECDVVISCRCSPTQKAEMVEAVQELTNKICCAIGDGGNDVSMILKANVGIGLLGKEGQQASLSSDFSIIRFEYLSVLLLWHGRLAYKNTAVISQFVIHRGLIIAYITTFFSVIFYFAAIPLFTGALMVGYTCVYTSLPVFSLVLDRDVSFKNSLFYPELYHSLQAGLSLNNKTLLLWIMRSFFQGSIIMLFTLILFEKEVHNICSITFTALILTELYNVYLEIHRIHLLMIVSELFSILLYVISVLMFSETYFDKDFVFSSTFIVKSLLIASVANLPVFIVKFIHKQCNPSMQAKLKDDRQ